MTHEIDQSNGKANVAFVGERPWHGLGQKLTEGASIDVWRNEAGLAWTAVKVPVEFRGSKNLKGTMIFKDRFVLMRDDTESPLGVVSKRYKIVQPNEVLEFFRDLVEASMFHIHTAGSLFGGQRIWALARANKDFVIGSKADKIEPYLLMSTSFDKTQSTRIIPTTVRVVCNNTLNISLADDAKGQTIRHLSVVDPKKVKEALKLAPEIYKQFKKQAEQLLATKVQIKMGRDFFLTVMYPKPSQKGYAEEMPTRVEGRIDELESLWKEDEVKAARGTAWGMLNAVTKLVDHGLRFKTSDTRLNSSFFGKGDRIKTRAFQGAMAMVLVKK